MEMDEYIKKETAYRAIMGERPEAREPSWFAELVLEIPAADVVEVVRCKVCQKCLIDNSKMELHLCMKRPSFPVRVKLDGFCSDGERKDGDGNG